MNNDLSDIATALTGSLARNGEGGMLDVLPMDPTGFNYENDSNTGMHRTGPDAQAIECGGVDIVDITSDGIDVNGDLTVNGLAILPIGIVLPWAGSAPPSLWLQCYGQSLLRSTYQDLFNVIGTAFGSVDGTHFNVPDLRGNVPAGNDAMGGVPSGRLTNATISPNATTLGASGGFQNITLIENQLPSLTKSASLISNAAGLFTYLNQGIYGAGGQGATNTISTTGQPTSVTIAMTQAAYNVSFGGGLSHINVQPTIILNYIIYTGV